MEKTPSRVKVFARSVSALAHTPAKPEPGPTPAPDAL